METFEKYQQQLLEQAQHVYYATPIREATQKAYLKTPRHCFVKKYREWGTKEWRKITDENLDQHLAMLYADRALIIFGDDDEDVASTISQPSLVLRMLDMLQLQPAQKVFEMGTGSGWNAALLGSLVGPAGCVYTVELYPEAAQTAAAIIHELGITNVQVIEADGGEGYSPGAPYDRAIFTAGAFDLPRCFYDQMKDGGLLLMVIKIEGGGDGLFLLRKVGNHFEAIDSMACAFIQMKGKYQLKSWEPIELESLPEWPTLRQKPAGSKRFWWAGKGQDDFLWRTLGVRSYLSVTEPAFRAFKRPRADDPSHDEHYFGLWDSEQQSLVLAKDDLLVAYGSPFAMEQLVRDIEHWATLGMPSAASLALQVFPAKVPLPATENQWIVKRQESQFLWSLSG